MDTKATYVILEFLGLHPTQKWTWSQLIYIRY